jgi:hypothetical protein
VFSSRIEKKSNLWYTRISTVPNKGISYYYDFINKFSNAKHFIEKYKDTNFTDGKRVRLAFNFVSELQDVGGGATTDESLNVNGPTDELLTYDGKQKSQPY